ncbi:hypothetical protein M011DRAFT_462809 [Sporormia fimetaria CBS 119925]|uniref:H-type lectin domain-containing protein n=1 Tax=Sporormia fimetaria CBS 119925 TaxID=1340428 RepID=A0A6A6UY79_9PLEO|nr:hypothetical protein M011DRAFT_462809 [Sporormia fimetaria CBS 119925]
MSIQLVPYNNAMRLGQGFNSYTQQICIDDAVVIDPNRAENVVTNDGTTMRIMVEKNAMPSAWSRLPEVVTDNRADAIVSRRNVEQVVDQIEMLPEEVAPGALGLVGESPNDTTDAAAAEESVDSGDIPADSAPEEMAQDFGDAPTGEASAEDTQVPAAAEDIAEAPLEGNNEGNAATETSEAAVDAHTPEEEAGGPAADTPSQGEAASATVVKGDTPKGDTRTDTADAPAKEGIRQTSRSLPSRKAGPRSSSVGAASRATKQLQKRTSPKATSYTPKITASGAALQRAAAKLKADAKKRAEEEVQLADIRKQEEIVRRRQEQKRIQEQRDYEMLLAKEAREEERSRRQEEREEQRAIRKEKRELESRRRQAMTKAIEEAAGLKAASMEELKEIAAQNQFVERFSGILENTQDYTFDKAGARGPSQTVKYNSRFVDRLSDVADDMCISGALSIQTGKFGGSGAGSFVDSDKFKESDLNWYISVEVVNQTINYKDPLLFNPVKSVNKDSFKDVFGDSFISGFVEGGTFNAIVSMKILNKAKLTDIKASAKVALTAGPVDIKAQASVAVAKTNIETNTETTIQVSWSGGGHIKPMEQQWDITSLMQAASRFPDLVADCPQRIYAILTKYETLRSYLALKPEGCSPMQYETAQIYTNALLDAFVSYKSIYKRLGEQIFNVNGKTLEIEDWQDKTGPFYKGEKPQGEKDAETGLYPYKEDLSKFEASVKGLSDARIAARKQMARIVNEVAVIEQYPKFATDEDHKEPFQSPAAFETRLPVVQTPKRLKRSVLPLNGKRIGAKKVSEEDEEADAKLDEELSNAPLIYPTKNSLAPYERTELDRVRDEHPLIGEQIQVSKSAVGSEEQGKPFNNLDFVKPDWVIDTIKVHVYNGSVSYVAVVYENGLQIAKGLKHNDAHTFAFGPFRPGERIVSASLEAGVRSSEKQPRVTAIGFFTNRGRSFLATAPTESKSEKKYTKDHQEFESVEVVHYDGPIENGTLRGFFGRSDDTGEGTVWRLGLIWGKVEKSEEHEKELKPLSLSSITSMVSDAQGPQSGVFLPSSWDAKNPTMASRTDLKFNYAEPPILISGLEHLDVQSKTPIHTDTRQIGITRNKATLVVRTVGQNAYCPAVRWLTIPRTDKHIEAGEYEFMGDESSLPNSGDWTRRTVTLPFSKPFNRAPTANVWLCEVSNTGDHYSAWVTPASTTTETVTINLWKRSQSGTTFANMRVGWFAYDPTECTNIQSETISGESLKKGRLIFPREYKNPPAVFMALRWFNAGSGQNLRLYGKVEGVREDGFDYECGTWASGGEHELKEFGYTWVAVG